MNKANANMVMKNNQLESAAIQQQNKSAQCRIYNEQCVEENMKNI